MAISKKKFLEIWRIWEDYFPQEIRDRKSQALYFSSVAKWRIFLFWRKHWAPTRRENATVTAVGIY
jgi:hypothetical protein